MGLKLKGFRSKLRIKKKEKKEKTSTSTVVCLGYRVYADGEEPPALSQQQQRRPEVPSTSQNTRYQKQSDQTSKGAAKIFKTENKKEKDTENAVKTIYQPHEAVNITLRNSTQVSTKANTLSENEESTQQNLLKNNKENVKDDLSASNPKTFNANNTTDKVVEINNTHVSYNGNQNSTKENGNHVEMENNKKSTLIFMTENHDDNSLVDNNIHQEKSASASNLDESILILKNINELEDDSMYKVHIVDHNTEHLEVTDEYDTEAEDECSLNSLENITVSQYSNQAASIFFGGEEPEAPNRIRKVNISNDDDDNLSCGSQTSA